MKAAYNKTTGKFVDDVVVVDLSNKSPTLHPGLGYHLEGLERQGLTADDVTVVDVPLEDDPWDKKLVDGKLIADTEKLVAWAEREESERRAVEDQAAALKSAQKKLKALGLNEAEIEALGITTETPRHGETHGEPNP